MFPVLQKVLDAILGTAWHESGAQLGAATFGGDPTGNLTPKFEGQFCKDTTNAALYWASSTTAASWKKLTP